MTDLALNTALTEPRLDAADIVWRRWPEVVIRIFDLPINTSVGDIYSLCALQGNISRIVILCNSVGKRTATSFVTFCPPPKTAIWRNGLCSINVAALGAVVRARIDLEAPRELWHESPVQNGLRYPERMTLQAFRMRMCVQGDKNTLAEMQTMEPHFDIPIQVMVNLPRRRVDVLFSIMQPALQEMKIEIPFVQLSQVFEYAAGENKTIWTISLQHSPELFTKVVNLVSLQSLQEKRWSESNHWHRQTEIANNADLLAREPVTLAQDDLIIDIGRWHVFQFEFDHEHFPPDIYGLMKQALNDYGISVMSSEKYNIIPGKTPSFRSWLDNTSKFAQLDKHALHELLDEKFILDFRVRYQLEVCLSKNCINELSITREFVQRLTSMSPTDAVSLLEYAAEVIFPFYDPMEVFHLHPPRNSFLRNSPEYCYRAYTVNITPSTVYYETPTLETSNRVIRHYQECSDRFLRVRFSDEPPRGKIHSADGETCQAVFDRIMRTLRNGITIGNRHFEFLAYGNSQLRDHGAYFYSSTPHLTAQDIRDWMGDFRHIRVVAKYASRIGQCFSTTRAIRGTKVQFKETEDIERNGFCFTDGVGKISGFLARVIASELKAHNIIGGPASVFQFRLGGCKGVLAIDPGAHGRDVYIRPSQYKFPARHEGLEIVRWATFATATLNQQVITILSALGVDDDAFLGLQSKMLHDLEESLSNERRALHMLCTQVDANQTSLRIAEIMKDGFVQAQDPFAMSVLHLWRAWTLKYLKEKARVVVENGAFVLGCVDETGSLQGQAQSTSSVEDADFKQQVMELPEIYLQIPDGDSGLYKPVEGICVVGRNPSLHLGDIRVVRAVNKPELSHLKDVVVFPQRGYRDIPGMCSGGDLDGDDYFVFWEVSLIPPQHNWNCEPMDFTPPKAVEANGPITVDDISSFFVNYMKNDQLGRIATSWLAIADTCGADHRDCVQLAALHSRAVDFPKTGQPAALPKNLKPRRFPHFMDNRFRPKERIYHSKRVLGQLYDQVELVDFRPLLHLPFDKRILDAYQHEPETLEAARETKSEYDTAMRRIMAQYQIKTEFEVWTTFVLEHASYKRKYDFHSEIGCTMAALRDQFKTICESRAGGSHFGTLAPFVAAMYTVTAEEASRALLKNGTMDSQGVSRLTHAQAWPLISFPWLFSRELGQIANGHQESRPNQQPSLNSDDNDQDLEIDLIDLEQGQDDVETEEGVTHRGDLLELFKDSTRDEMEGVQGTQATVSSGYEKSLRDKGSQQSSSTWNNNRSFGPASLIDELMVDDHLLQDSSNASLQPVDNDTPMQHSSSEFLNPNCNQILHDTDNTASEAMRPTFFRHRSSNPTQPFKSVSTTSHTSNWSSASSVPSLPTSLAQSSPAYDSRSCMNALPSNHQQNMQLDNARVGNTQDQSNQIQEQSNIYEDELEDGEVVELDMTDAPPSALQRLALMMEQ